MKKDQPELSDKPLIFARSKKEKRNFIKFIGISIFFSVLPSIILLLSRLITDQDISKIYLPLIAFPINILVVSLLYPRVFKIPFGKCTSKEMFEKLGVFNQKKGSDVLKLIGLGVCLAVLSLGGMLMGSLLSGKYTFDLSRLTWEQIIFSTVPGVWEEIFFRGIIMFLLIPFFKTKNWAIFLQSFVFAICHFHDFQLWDIIDLISIGIMGFVFTYTADKTNSLIPGIVFHTLHDAFIFLVQVGDEVIITYLDNVYFYLCLWVMLFMGLIIIRLLTKHSTSLNNQYLFDVQKVVFIYEKSTQDNSISEDGILQHIK